MYIICFFKTQIRGTFNILKWSGSIHFTCTGKPKQKRKKCDLLSCIYFIYFCGLELHLQYLWRFLVFRSTVPTNTQQWPQDWKRSVFIPIPKKGNTKEWSNYHTIALISHASNPIDGSLPGFLVPGILQARTLEWVAISFSNAWKWKVKRKSLRVCLFATPWTAAYQAPPSMGFSRQVYWSGVPLPCPEHKGGSS